MSKDYHYYLVRVKDSIFKTPTLEIVLVVREFPKFFQQDLLGILSEREIDF